MEELKKIITELGRVPVTEDELDNLDDNACSQHIYVRLFVTGPYGHREDLKNPWVTLEFFEDKDFEHRGTLPLDEKVIVAAKDKIKAFLDGKRQCDKNCSDCEGIAMCEGDLPRDPLPTLTQRRFSFAAFWKSWFN